MEGLRVGVDIGIATNCPDVLDHSCSCRDEISSINVVLHGSVWDGDGERCVPSENLLHQSVDVRQVVFIREIREMPFSNDSIQFFLRSLHYLGVENHCQEERFQGRSCLNEALEN